MHNISNCAYSCHADISPSQQDFLDRWIAVWAWSCLVLSALTVLTFLIDMQRFPYPERPIFYLSCCQLMIAAGYLLRLHYGHDSVACEGELLLKRAVGLSLPLSSDPTGGQPNLACLATFVLTYFFGMAASAWWIVLSLSWVLAAVPHWSTEWITRYSTYFHLFAWLVPAGQTTAAIVMKTVEGDGISGMCYVGTTSVGNMRTFLLGEWGWVRGF